MTGLSETGASELFRQAVIANQQGEFAKAEALGREALKHDPSNADAHYLIGAILLDKGHPDAALTHLENAHRLLPAHPGILYALGNAHFLLENWPSAIEIYQTLHAHGRISAYTYLNLATALVNIKNSKASAETLQQALAVYPKESALWNAYGDTLNKLRRDTDAESAYTQALELKPDDPDIRANLALLHEQSNQLDKAEALAMQGLINHPRHASLLLTAARCARRRKQFTDALRLLDQIPGNADIRFRRAAEFERGRIYDSLAEPDVAFAHFKLGNALAVEIRPDGRQGAKIYINELDDLRRRLEQADVLTQLAKTSLLASDNKRPSPVFLVGFLRSGTTLMDTILQTHSRVIVLEEEPTLDGVIQHAQTLSGGYPECLAATTPDQRSDLRSLYWNTVADITGPLAPETVLIDKQPLNSVNAPLIHALFPDARFLFALRHPCDVVLSCFMQMFGTSNAHMNFTSLEGGAMVYSRFMELWLKCVRTLPLRAHTLRYEDLVRDKDRVMTEVLDFLGLDTTPDMEHAEKAKQRGRIYTPSYHQVIQPIYQDALDRWRRYRKHFGQTLEILRPFADTFGYEI
ncbi:MAG TPA: sulfotransferase [Gammaproteobacteria bacterium]|nr:sulfotransferase [Gammaproteobacteria bacterium]